MREKILVIEDEKVIRENLTYLLSLTGFEVRAAANGNDGISEAILFKPDLILCDVMMQGIDGFEVVEILRRKKDFSMTPFIFLTAKGELSDMRRGMILGADDYLTKPFTLDELMGTVEARLKRRVEIDHIIQNRIQDIYKKQTKTTVHEFNTSLNTIMGFTGFLREDYGSLDQQEVKELLGLIYTSSNHFKRNLDSTTIYNELVAMNESNVVKSELTSGVTMFDGEFVKSIWAEIKAYFLESQPELLVDIQAAGIVVNEFYLKKYW